MARPLGVYASAVHIASSFNPLTQVTATHAMWAGDPSWSNPGDGNPVDSWRNQSGGGDPAMTGSNRPTYRASVAGLNNRPAIEFAGASSQRLFFDTATVSQPYKWVVVAQATSTASNPMIVGTATSSTHGLRIITSGTLWRFNVGANCEGGTADTNPHAFRLTANGASSQLWVDEVSVAAADAGANNQAGICIGSGATTTPSFSSPFTGYVAFVGIYDGATSDAGLTTLVGDLRTHYGF